MCQARVRFLGKTKSATWNNSNNNDHPGATPFNDLCGEAPPERGICFRLQVYKRVGISFLEVYEMIGKSFILVCKK